MKKALMTMNVSERYEAIRGFQQSFQLSPTKTIRNLLSSRNKSNAN